MFPCLKVQDKYLNKSNNSNPKQVKDEPNTYTVDSLNLNNLIISKEHFLERLMRIHIYVIDRRCYSNLGFSYAEEALTAK